MKQAQREKLGTIVRGIWVQHARHQPNPKPHHLEPWEKLDEPNKEVDRQIGQELFELGMKAVDVACQECNRPLHRELVPGSSTVFSIEPCHCQTSEIARLREREEYVSKQQMRIGTPPSLPVPGKPGEIEPMFRDPEDDTEINWKLIAGILGGGLIGVVVIVIIVLALRHGI